MPNIKVLVVGGGGAGAFGGGGGGGVVSNTSFSVDYKQYSVTVGSGGSGKHGSQNYHGKGADSVFDTITAYGGGSGAINADGTGYINGGCGGGAEWSQGPGYGSQGYCGGGTDYEYTCGGGGGAGGPGGNSPSGLQGGNGGTGVANSITGSSVYYGGGGGGSYYWVNAGSSVSSGGTGGGGNGGCFGTNPTAGTNGLGGGGGGHQYNGVSGSGGSGVVILRYATADFGTNTHTGSPTVTTSGSDTIVRFTGSGTITFVEPPVVVPTVTTQNASSITQTKMTGNGNITATGGANATRRGFCYKTGTSGDPTVSDSVAYDDGSFGTGAFTKSITGLTAGTDYRVRAYAVNSAGTSYGSTVGVKTLSAFKPRTTWFN